jgi:hypothetical protein
VEKEIDDVVISWSNVGNYCRVVFFFGLPEEQTTDKQKSDLRVLEREQTWELPDIYGIPQNEKGKLNFIEKDRARKLWTRLQEEHGFYLIDSVEGEEDES